MKLTGPLQSDEARGRLGPVVYGTLRGTRYLRAYVKPKQPDTPAQLACRQVTRDANALWKTIDDNWRNSWNAYALTVAHPDWTGKPRRPTGHNLFVAAYQIGALLGAGPPSTPPKAPAPPALETVSYSYDGSTCYLTWTPLAKPNYDDLAVELFWIYHVPPAQKPDFHWAAYHSYALYGSASLPVACAEGTSPALWLRLVDFINFLPGPWQLLHPTLSTIPTGSAHGRLMNAGNPVSGYPVDAAGLTANSNYDGYFLIPGLPVGLQTVIPRYLPLVWIPPQATALIQDGLTREFGVFYVPQPP